MDQHEMKSQRQDHVADARMGNLVERFAPSWALPYLQLSRLDRPIGFWLLFWPCAFSVGLSAVARPPTGFDFYALALFLIGSIAMRGAGCTLNDLVDVDLDRQVERTRSRPLPSGRVSKRNALIWLAFQCLIGLVVLLQLSGFAIFLGFASVGLVVIYPFMKRITWWPQLFLGLAFSWGALMGWANSFSDLFLPVSPPILLYLGCILWVIGYDTIYALQDVEDDAIVGIKSTARLFGNATKPIVALFYAGAFALWIWASWWATLGGIILVAAMVPAALILIWQVLTLDINDGQNALNRFKANHYVGLALTVAFYIEFRF